MLLFIRSYFITSDKLYYLLKIASWMLFSEINKNHPNISFFLEIFFGKVMIRSNQLTNMALMLVTYK